MPPFAVHCGMPDEKSRLARAFGPDVPILSGTDKFKLDVLVPAGIRFILNMGVCGGLSPPLTIADVGAAVNVVDKAGLVIDLQGALLERCAVAAKAKGIIIHPVPWYSSGLLDEADTKGQRSAINARYATRPQCIDDESHFTVAFAAKRNIPCAVIRPLSDDWSETLPLEARGAIMNSNGAPNVAYLFKTFRPVDLPMLDKIALDYGRSLDALEAVARAIAPALLAA